MSTKIGPKKPRSTGSVDAKKRVSEYAPGVHAAGFRLALARGDPEVAGASVEYDVHVLRGRPDPHFAHVLGLRNG